MNKPNGYDSSETKVFYGNEFVSPGPYVLGIIKSEITESRGGNEMLVLSLDIARGQYQRRFRELSDQLQRDCLLKHRRLTDTEKSLPYLKGDIKAIEESNDGYKFNFDESSLRGKLVGGMLSEVEYEKNDGSIGTILKVAFLCSIKTVESGNLKIPAKKLLDLGNKRSERSISDDDLPF